MRKTNGILLLCLLIALPWLSRAQPEPAPSFVSERILLHTDRPLYVSGEVIWFKVFNFDRDSDRLTDFSRVAYLEMINQAGVAVSRIKVDLKSGRGHGSIELPAALAGGSYTLRAYTQAMRNTGEEAFARVVLIILHPGQPILRADPARPEAYTSFEPKRPSLALAGDNYLDITVENTQKEIGQRSLTTLEITTKDAGGKAVPAELSLSVALQSAEAGSDNRLFRKKETRDPGIPATLPARITYPPENIGMHLSGTVINETSQSGAAGVEVFLAFPGKTARVYVAVTDENGQFSFLLPTLYGLRQVVLQTRSEEELLLRIELDEEFERSIPATPQPFVLPPQWVPLANAALVNAQVEQAYQTFELPPEFSSENPFAGVPVFGSPDAQYLLDDYNRFPLPEFFFEIVYEVMVKGKYGEERLEVVMDAKSPLIEGEPLFLVDGVPVFDQGKFLKINNKLIASTEIITSPFWLNPVFFNGVIQLSSFEGDARCITLPESAQRRSFLTLLPQRKFAAPDHSENPENRMPDFRNTLYWNPSIRTNADGKATVSFFTSDAVGEYEIRAEGVNSEGLAGTGLGTIKVVKEIK